MNVVEKKPEIIVFAGPNGSGKSTITTKLRPKQLPYVNADDIVRETSCTNLEAAVKAESLRETYLADKSDFCFETVLSTDRNLNLLKRAKDVGYFIRCYYVLTYDPMINVARVKSRVQAGGHDVEVEKIINRYGRCLDMVAELITVCDVCNIYDNSNAFPYRIFKKRKDAYFYSPETSLWLKEDIIQLTGIENPIKTALNKTKILP